MIELVGGPYCGYCLNGRLLIQVNATMSSWPVHGEPSFNPAEPEKPIAFTKMHDGLKVAGAHGDALYRQRDDRRWDYVPMAAVVS